MGGIAVGAERGGELELQLFAGNDGHRKRKGVAGCIRAVGFGLNCDCVGRWKV